VLIADWKDVLFVHFRIDPEILAPAIPFELDLFDGDAYFSLVAFTQSRLRPTIGGQFTEFFSRAIATHEFLNLRTYVRFNDDPGIYFIAEWIPNALATLIGPRLYGLPYRRAKLDYHHADHRNLHGQIIASERNLSYCAAIDSTEFHRVAPQTLDHFLLERYLAFTHRNGITRQFRVKHEPWLTARADVELVQSTLLEPLGWMSSAQIVAANFSPGAKNVRIGKPERIICFSHSAV
jgi:uncharacterized protein YqjF (DUF2071 family)